MNEHTQQIAAELGLEPRWVDAAIELIDAGNTIPFIARYRKEATHSMDDQALRQLADRLEYLRGLDKRRSEVRASIETQGALTAELDAALAKAATLAELEDLYRPYKPKRKTRASVAEARGLQPLADALLAQDPQSLDVENAAAEGYMQRGGARRRRPPWPAPGTFMAEQSERRRASCGRSCAGSTDAFGQL